MNFTQIFKKLNSHIYEIEKEEVKGWIDYYDFATGKNSLVVNTEYTYKNIKITPCYFETRISNKTEVVRETKLFHDDKEIELNKTTAHKLINFLKEI